MFNTKLDILCRVYSKAIYETVNLMKSVMLEEDEDVDVEDDE